MESFDVLQERAEKVKRLQRSVDPLSDEWFHCEKTLLHIYSAQYGSA